MPVDEKMIADFDRHIKNVTELKEWFDKLYFDPEFSTIFTRPILSIMITGCSFLIENLNRLKTTYLAQPKG